MWFIRKRHKFVAQSSREAGCFRHTSFYTISLQKKKKKENRAGSLQRDLKVPYGTLSWQVHLSLIYSQNVYFGFQLQVVHRFFTIPKHCWFKQCFTWAVPMSVALNSTKWTQKRYTLWLMVKEKKQGDVFFLIFCESVDTLGEKNTFCILWAL